jgi:hypothetical protein
LWLPYGEGGSYAMGWLDGMTGCQGECQFEGSSVTFKNFALDKIKNLNFYPMSILDSNLKTLGFFFQSFTFNFDAEK